MVLWWVLGIVLGLTAAYVLLLCLSALAVDPNRIYDTQGAFGRWVLDLSVKLLVFFGHVKVVSSGFEKLPEGRFLLVSNHRSNYDPIAALYGMPERELAFLSKEANMKLPVVGRILRRCCFMTIDRENPRNAIVTIRKAAELMENDVVSIGVYPEGTRSKTCQLLPFHSGVLKAAQHAHVPVVVMAVRGSEEIRKNAPWRRTTVHQDVIAVLSAEHVAQTRSTALGEEVYALLDDYLKREDKAYEMAGPV